MYHIQISCSDIVVEKSEAMTRTRMKLQPDRATGTSPREYTEDQ